MTHAWPHIEVLSGTSRLSYIFLIAGSPKDMHAASVGRLVRLRHRLQGLRKVMPHTCLHTVAPHRFCTCPPTDRGGRME